MLAEKTIFILMAKWQTPKRGLEKLLLKHGRKREKREREREVG